MRRAALATALALLAALWWMLAGNRTAVREARAAARVLQDQRDSLAGVVARRDAQQALLTARADTLERAAGRLRDSVALLERDRAGAQLAVRQVRTTSALQARLRQAFPELGGAGWGLTSLPAWEGDTLGIEYLLVPAWFAETFMIDRANARSWLAQRATLLAADSLRAQVATLRDSIVILEAANASAWETGYQAASAGYQDLSRRYQAELRKPRLTAGPALGLLVAAGAAVLVVGNCR
jgi:hypothetical protein